VGTLFSALDIARSGMQAAQIQMDVAGHNIANVNKEGFSRQRVSLASRYPNYRTYGALGRGVDVQTVERLRDAFLDQVYRQQMPDLGSAEVRASYFGSIEDVFHESDDSGLSSQINQFFSALNDFATNVESQPYRQSVVSEASALAATLREVDQRLELLRTNANEEVRNLVPEINAIAERIADLNDHIHDIEATGTEANDMRDERDLLADQLAGLINVTIRERADGQFDVLVGGELLVSGATYRRIEAVRNPALDPERSDLVEVRFADNGHLVEVRSGELYGALSMRDTEVVAVTERIDTIAATLIEQINRIHAQGRGLVAWSGTVSSTNPVSVATDPLIAAGLPFDVTAGTIEVVVYDASNSPTTTSITVTAGTTLASFISDLNGIAGIDASLGADGVSLELSAEAGHTLRFANDTSGVLTALGVNGLFTGRDAASIAINSAVADDPRLLASGYSVDLSETGDNQAALAMAAVLDVAVVENNTSTLTQYYESTIVQIGIAARSNTERLQVERAFADDFEQRRQEVSGVSLDEEVTNMILYQRAFEASSRVASVTNAMLESLLAMF